MKSFSFFKYSGAGNDFILIEKSNNENITFNREEITKLCARRTGIGADGVLLFSDSDTSDFCVEYYNADGSTGMLCANGARCSIFHAAKSRSKDFKLLNFSANGKNYSGKVIEDKIVRLNLNPPSGLKRNIVVEFDGKKLIGDFIDTGSPHLVIDTGSKEFHSAVGDILENLDADLWGSKIRNLEMFAPVGVNVNFLEISSGSIKVRTFEKGVEAETLASGTGTVATGIIASLKYKLVPPLDIITGGGIKMKVDFTLENDTINNVSLTGPVDLVYRGEFFI